MAKEKQEEEEKANMEARILGSLQSRLQHFRDNASSLTLAGIRRILEEDLGFEKYALDVHKSFIKQFIEKNLNDDDDYETKNSDSHTEKEANSSVGEATKSPEKEDLARTSPSDEAEKEEDSPIMGVLTPKTEMVDSQGIEISESMLKNAIWERADYIRSQSEKLTLAGARRFLEDDLKLSKNALDPFKKIIREQIEKVFDANDVSTSAMSAKRKSSGNRQSKAAESTSSERKLGSIDDDDDDEQHKMKSSGKTVRRVEAKKLDREKKRKRPEKKIDVAVKNQSKLVKRHSEESSDADNEGDVSDDGESQSAKKSVKKKEASTPTFGKHVEHLKSVIKACGMSIAPTVYKKAKQVPDGKREAFLIKELEDILAKEGLSKNPSEKEIKEVRKRKERAKELEGIDLSNIITSSRRRSAMSFLPPPKPQKKEKGRDDAVSTDKDKDAVSDDNENEKQEQEKDGDNAVSTDKDEDGGNDDKKKEKQEREEDEEVDDEEGEEDGDDSQSEDFNGGDEDSD
ncbi:high mobility group nucleosome-binding domain-containing protein 5 isoform X1 [Coffea eugenioides]|uniref:high mobility group nucleosome-binding domain-containing protein 5 isoform X1 n=1 Tax=Coffea eugenioides TaxID=49369 RepID=UPI000F60C44F|nr:high mobility group nucleosome-binding domain-containing protein 5 isoform X1 [Coffea eugenioides]XP_027147917.1 high mobility group nucleosome-binding domain-containing protein 5 isoform X1 [Coffea eugenioides]